MGNACLYLRSTSTHFYNRFGIELSPSAMDDNESQPKKFESKKPVELNPPKSDPIAVSQLAECNGMALPTSLLSSSSMARTELISCANTYKTSMCRNGPCQTNACSHQRHSLRRHWKCNVRSRNWHLPWYEVYLKPLYTNLLLSACRYCLTPFFGWFHRGRRPCALAFDNLLTPSQHHCHRI